MQITCRADSSLSCHFVCDLTLIMWLFWENDARCFLVLTTLITRQTGGHVLNRHTGLFPRVVTESLPFVLLFASHVAECPFNDVTEDSLQKQAARPSGVSCSRS